MRDQSADPLHHKPMLYHVNIQLLNFFNMENLDIIIKYINLENLNIEQFISLSNLIFKLTFILVPDIWSQKNAFRFTC